MKTEILKVTPADENHQVITLKSQGSNHVYRREPCGGCPWRTDQDGSFPAEAFRISAVTAYDMSDHVFACHESGSKASATCAGFLLRGSHHNMTVRIGRLQGLFRDVHDGGHELHDSYRAMAEANGVPTDDPVLKDCRE